MTTKVTIDGSPFADGSQHRGIGTVARRVVAGLAALPDLDVVVASPDEAVVPDGVARLSAPLGKGGRLGPAVHRISLPRAVRRSRPDVVLSLGAGIPPRLSSPTVAVINDLTPLVFDHPLLRADARRWRRHAPRLEHVSIVVVPSGSTADQVRSLLDVPMEKIRVVPYGADEEFCPGPYPVEAGDPYVLAVSSWGPHKGFGDAAAAVAALVDSGISARLVIAGRQDSWMHEQLANEVRASPRPDVVEILGWVSDLPALYRGAAAFVCTSRAEGFGLPVLEAMACGTPVVAYANTSLPELVADGGVIVRDGDPLAVAEALRPLLLDPAARASASARAVQRARCFSWELAVGSIAEALWDAAGR